MLNSIIDRCKGILHEEIELHSQKSLEADEAQVRQFHLQHMASMEKNTIKKIEKLRNELGSGEYDKIYLYLI